MEDGQVQRQAAGTPQGGPAAGFPPGRPAELLIAHRAWILREDFLQMPQ
jgi:hypothetical protein